MTKPPVKKEKHDLKPMENKEVQPFSPFSMFNPFISFTYSSRTLTSAGDKTHIQAEEHRLENGRIESKRFEGTLDENYFEEISKNMQIQMDFFLDSMKLFIPFR